MDNKEQSPKEKKTKKERVNGFFSKLKKALGFILKIIPLLLSIIDRISKGGKNE